MTGCFFRGLDGIGEWGGKSCENFPLVFYTIASIVNHIRKKGGVFLKGNGYTLLSALSYDRKDEYEAFYQRRIHSEECVLLDFTIGGNPAFYLETTELLKTVVEIVRIDKEVAVLSSKLPVMALQQYRNKCLIDEIVITNNIEGVHSTRREIGELLDDLESRSNRRFYGLVNKYAALQYEEPFRILESRDIRALYDEMFLKEVLEENKEDEPDGVIFRAGHVDVINPAQKVIHQGVYPESRIIQCMDSAIRILNDATREPLFRIAVFHYLFGYIHPFYDGNGRLNRFISSDYLARFLEPIMAYRLSYTIKENIGRYYKSFKTVNDKRNRGDVTPFIYTFLEFIRESADNLRQALKTKEAELALLSDNIHHLPKGTDEKYHHLYQLLLQASLFSETGISTGDLLDNLSISRPTLQKRLQLIEESNLLITMKREAHKFYQMNREEAIKQMDSSLPSL